jgi:MFS family permease
VIGGEFQLSGVQTGLITSAYFLCYTAMQIPTGLLGDRIGLRRTLLALYLLAGIGISLLGLFAVSYVTLLLFVALHGLGAGGYYTPSYGMTMATVPKALRGISSGVITVGMSLGLAIGLATSGPLYKATLNWRLPLLFLAVPTLIMVVVFALTIKDVRHSTQGPRLSFKEVIFDKDVFLLTFAEFCMLWGYWVVINWGPTFFKEERGLDIGIAGMFTAIAAISSIPAALTMGAISDRIGRRTLTLIMLPIAALTVFALGYVQSTTLLVLVLVLYGFVGISAWHPVMIAWAGDHIAARRPQAMGAAMGFVNALAVSSAILSPPVSGWLKDVTHSLGAAFYLGGAIIICGAIGCLFVEETVKRPSSRG